ncbi:hypothetical protein LFZ31_27945, partial [Salmonella enterica subsp. enterica serovar Newport str. S09097]
FWLFKGYFNLSVGETLRTWTVMETLISVMGLTGRTGAECGSAFNSSSAAQLTMGATFPAPVLEKT